MYLKKGNTIKDTAQFKVEAGVLCTQMKKNYQFSVDQLNIGNTMYDGFFIADNWFFNGIDDNLYQLDPQHGLKKLLEGKSITDLDRENNIALLSFEPTGAKYKRAIFDPKYLQLLTKSPQEYEMWQLSIRKYNVYFSSSKQDIYGLNLINNEVLWHYNLNKLEDNINNKAISSFIWEVHHFIGIINGVLWIDITRNVQGFGGAILGINIETGDAIHFLTQIDHQKTTQRFEMSFLPFWATTFYDKKSHKLIGFAHTLYWEVDLSKENLEISLWNFWDYFAEFREGENVMGLEFSRGFQDCGITDTHIFSPVGSAGMIPQIFAFNRNTHQVDWRHIMQSENNDYYMPTKVDVTDNYLYVLDSESTLHIFERES